VAGNDILRQVFASILEAILITTANSGVASAQCFQRNTSEIFQVAASTAMIAPDPWNWQLD
jgi:hypothetical protein